MDLGSAAPQKPSLGRKRWQRLTRALGRRRLAAGVIALGIVGVAFWTLPRFWKTAVPAPTPLPYSIAILPFAAAGGSPADEQFADALTNDLTMVLGRGRAARVVSHSLAVTYKGKAIDARAVGRELNVLYLVEGEVRRTGERIIVSASVIDAGNATQLWSDRLDVDPAQTTQETGSLIAILTGRVRNAVDAAENRRASAPLPAGASVMDLVMHAYAVYDKDPNSLATVLEARRMFDQALRFDPNLVFAMNGRATTLSGQLALDLHADHDRLVQELDEVSTRAVYVDPNNAYAWSMRTEALTWQWRWEAALEANAKATRLQPFNPWLLSQHAKLMLDTGHPTEVLAQLDKVLALQPQNNQALGYALLLRCCAYQVLGRYDDAIAACEKSVAEDDWWLGHAYLVAAYAQKGETAKAEAEKITLLKQQPGVSLADLKAQRVSNNPAYLQQTETHLYAALRKAGIPEQ